MRSQPSISKNKTKHIVYDISECTFSSLPSISSFYSWPFSSISLTSCTFIHGIDRFTMSFIDYCSWLFMYTCLPPSSKRPWSDSSLDPNDFYIFDDKPPPNFPYSISGPFGGVWNNKPRFLRNPRLMSSLYEMDKSSRKFPAYENHLDINLLLLKEEDEIPCIWWERLLLGSNKTPFQCKTAFRQQVNI